MDQLLYFSKQGPCKQHDHQIFVCFVIFATYENFIIGQSLHVVHNSLMGHFKAFHGPEVAHGPYVACSCVRPNWKIKLIKVNSKTLKNQAQIFKAFNLNQNFLVFGEFQEKQCQNPSKTETKQSKEVNVCGWVGNTLLKKLIWCLKNRCLVNSTDSMQLVYCTVCKTALEPIKYRAINGTAVLLNTIID